MNLTTIVSATNQMSFSLPILLLVAVVIPQSDGLRNKQKKSQPKGNAFCHALRLTNYYVNDCKCYGSSLVLTFNFLFCVFSNVPIMECIILPYKLHTIIRFSYSDVQHNIYATIMVTGLKKRKNNNEKQQHNELLVSHFEFQKHKIVSSVFCQYQFTTAIVLVVQSSTEFCSRNENTMEKYIWKCVDISMFYFSTFNRNEVCFYDVHHILCMENFNTIQNCVS